MDGRYEPIPIVEVAEGALQGYSAALDLNIRWSRGRLEWHDPQTGEHIPTFEQERDLRLQAEARNRELEEELHRLRGRIARHRTPGQPSNRPDNNPPATDQPEQHIPVGSRTVPCGRPTPTVQNPLNRPGRHGQNFAHPQIRR